MLKIIERINGLSENLKSGMGIMCRTPVCEFLSHVSENQDHINNARKTIIKVKFEFEFERGGVPLDPKS